MKMEKIDFFDEEMVGPEARRLAFCFNVSARMVPQNGNPLSHAEELFKASTGLEEIPFFNKHEETYLRLNFLEVAAIRDQGQTFSVDELTEAANVLFLDAKDMNLVRRYEGPPDREGHPSFPGE
jgi:hypothetical protein